MYSAAYSLELSHGCNNSKNFQSQVSPVLIRVLHPCTFQFSHSLTLWTDPTYALIFCHYVCFYNHVFLNIFTPFMQMKVSFSDPFTYFNYTILTYLYPHSIITFHLLSYRELCIVILHPSTYPSLNPVHSAPPNTTYHILVHTLMPALSATSGPKEFVSLTWRTSLPLI